MRGPAPRAPRPLAGLLYVAVMLGCAAGSWHHGRFDGLTVLALLVIGAAIALLALSQPEQAPQRDERERRRRARR